MADAQATFSLKVDADSEPAKEAASELEKFRQAIVKSQDALASYRKSQALLKGSSDEVKDAKLKLKAAIELERGKISANNLAILKLGGSYDKLAKATKKNTLETDHGRKAIVAIGGPAKGLLERFDGLKDLLPAISSGWGLLAAGVAVGVAAFALAAAGVADLTIKFSDWLLTTADANRNLQLTREAFSGSTKNATAWGHVLDWASEKTALTTAQMNEMIVATEKTYRGFRISGQGMVDAFKASAAAAGAGRADVGAFFDEIIARGKQSGRSFIGPADFARFRNAGIAMKDVYKELGISAAQAQQGAVVSTDKMAAALRKLSENRFAELNGKKMLSLGAQWDHFKDNLMRFTNDLIGEGGALEPLLKSIAEVAKMFDLSTESGQEMKAAITEYGTAAAAAIKASLPKIKETVVAAMKFVAAAIKASAAVIQWAQSAEGIATIKIILIAIAAAAVAVGVAFLPLIAIGLAIGVAFAAVGAAVYGVYEAVKWISDLKWSDIGKAIVAGIKNGLESAAGALKNSVLNLGKSIKDAFASSLGIHSPSRVFAEYGFQTGAGYQQGVARATPAVVASTTAMATEAKGAATGAQGGAATPSAPGGGGGGGLHIGTIENHFTIGAGKNAEEVKAALSSRSFLEGFEQSFKILLQSQGIPTAVSPSSGG